jgi:DEAD/DEAH box helicase domain-containing protein
MLPLLQAEEIKQSVTEYLKATFSFADRNLRQAFEDFLMDKRKGMFKGPYLQIRLPFSKEGKMEELNTLLEITPDFIPFDHQFEAFRRLSARNDHNPEPVILTTGTGSGKTESFLFPILDYCYQHQDQPGIKAIILYPMNALATDQAKRLAAIIYNYRNEEGKYVLREKLRAGLFIGEGKDKKSALRSIRMGEENIIEDRDTLVQSPPDILFTNFKMLDFSLMQARFHGIWKYNFQNPELLKYLVLDELHTYDGAKGSDVANLIRRLKLKLKLPADKIVPVGTSATMSGGEEGKETLVKFFSQIFGLRVGMESIIEESRLDPDLFFESDLRIPEISIEDISTCEFKEADDYQTYIIRQLEFWNYPEIDPIELGVKLKENRWVYELVVISGGATKEISEIVSIWADKTSISENYDYSEQHLIFSSLLALITYAKDQSGAKAFPFLFVQITYWMRSLHRMLRKTQITPVFEWESDVNPVDKVKSLPPYYCRECGGSGWVGIKKEHSNQFEDDLARTRQMFMSDRGNKNIFLVSPFPDNDISKIFAEDYSPTGDPVLGYLDPYNLNIFDRNQNESLFRIIGVRRQNDDKIEKVCPHCNSVNTLALIGTGLPTLESIATAQVLASSTDQAPDQQRKLLAFTNGVQDAAHQAGFIENRNYRFGMRHAIQQVLKNQENILPLNSLYQEFEKYWQQNIEAKTENKAEAYFYKYLPPDCESRFDISDFQIRNGSFKPVFEKEFSNRMAWEIWSEFSYNASIGRTLEKSGASATGFSVDILDKIYDQMKKWLQENKLGDRITQETFLKFLNGFLHRLRTRGGVDHLYLNRYRTGKSQSYLITYKMNRDHFMIRSFGPDFRLPRFITLEKGRYTDVFDVIKISKNQNWYSTYFLKSFPLVAKEETELINDFYTQLVENLDANEVLDKKVAAGIVNYGLKPEQISIHHENSGFECDTCGHQLHVIKGNEAITSEMSCMQYRCPGHYNPMDEEFLNYYRMIYNRGRSLRIFAHDHTGLIDRNKREQLEKDFKERPNYKSINVLVATSTLEMGIDIGDLNVAFNSSLPPETSNYLQRVGRAGRSSGNSMILNIAGRGEHDLFFYQDPMSMMNGIIRTPACYLEAKDILKRHFMAFCFDSWASLDPDQNRIPHIIKQLKVKSLEPGDSQFILTQISDFIHSNKSELFDKFSEQYKTDIPEGSTVLNDLKEQLISGFLESRLIEVHKRLKDELNYYEKRKKQLGDRLKNLPQTGDESQFLRSEQRALSGAINNIYRRNTIEYLTNIGILPNYAFPETGVSINPILRKRKELDGVVEYKNQELPEIVRPSSQAITELAPANFFYSQGHKFESQGMEVLSADEYEEYRFCSNCDHMVSEVDVGKDELSCQKCGHNSWGSINNKKTLLKIRAVLSYNDYEESKITDSSDERDRKFYQRSIHIQTDAGSSKGARILKRVPFGIEFFANTRYVDINTGVREEGFFGTREIEINGEKVPEVGFVICKTCGKTTERKLTDKEIEKRKRSYHFPYCSNREQQYVGHRDEFFEEIYLYREFQTEALKILLPVQEFRTEERVSVFKAGLFLGLKDYYKGHPDHVNIKEYQEYNKETGRKERYLVMYETIPGGTGYLSRLFDPVEFTRLLEAAYDHIRFCKCKDEGRDGCYHCIYTYGNQYERDVLSRKEAEELFGSIVEKADEWNEIESLQGAGNYANNEESDLENGFIEILKEKETTWPGWKFTDINEAGYKKYKLIIPLKEGSISYEIWPQNLGNYLSGIELKTRPDFVFRCVSITNGSGESSMEEVQKVKDIIIYLDGHEYHASKDHRRIPSDIKIRNSIVSSGKYHLWIFTWKDIEDHRKALNDYLGEMVQENTIKSMLKGHPSFKSHQDSVLYHKNNFQRFFNLLSGPLNFMNPRLWSSLILFSLQKEMLSDCYPESVIKSNFIPAGNIDNSIVSKGDPERFTHIKDLKFLEELLMEVFIHPKDFTLIGYSRFDDEKVGWEKENWNKFWETYNLTQFHQFTTISYKDHEKMGESSISVTDHILNNFDPELHKVVKILIDNNIKINEEYDFDLIRNDEIIAQAELGSYESMFFCKPFDAESKKVFLESGYNEIFVENFDIKTLTI